MTSRDTSGVITLQCCCMFISLCDLFFGCQPSVIYTIDVCILLGRLRTVDLKPVSNSQCPFAHPSVHKKIRFERHLVCRLRSMSDTRRYAIWPDPRSRSWRSKRCGNGRFQSQYMHVIKKLTVNCDTPREYLNFETISVCSQPPRSTQPFIPPG